MHPVAQPILACSLAPGPLHSPERVALLDWFIGWSSNQYNNLHLIISLETNQTTTYAAG